MVNDMREEVLYRKRECEICGEIAYEKHLGTAKVLDGGFTRVEDWEKSGFCRLVATFWYAEHLNDGRIELTMCPACAKKVHSNLTDYIRGLKVEAQGVLDGGAEDD